MPKSVIWLDGRHQYDAVDDGVLVTLYSGSERLNFQLSNERFRALAMDAIIFLDGIERPSAELIPFEDARR